MGKKELERHPQLDETTEIEKEQTVESEIKAEPVDDEKKFVNQKESFLNDIKELEEKNVVLEKEAEKFDNLASTMNAEPFIELKSLVKESIKTYTDREDIKELKTKIKNFESISQMEDLLIEYKNLAAENRSNIEVNKNEIERYKEKIEELDSKIKNFQTKLDLGDKAEQD